MWRCRTSSYGGARTGVRAWCGGADGGHRCRNKLVQTNRVVKTSGNKGRSEGVKSAPRRAAKALRAPAAGPEESEGSLADCVFTTPGDVDKVQRRRHPAVTPRTR
ncbi:hypothetical protein BN2537_6477 [Streptomyces venezuelae]|nr:hypothetical protein BN2537_6477 [Streptomyces venezuelae]